MSQLEPLIADLALILICAIFLLFALGLEFSFTQSGETERYHDQDIYREPE
jgi:hypothetical protein